MAEPVTIGIEHAWRKLMVLFGGTLARRASANQVVVRALRAGQGRR